MCVCVRIIIYFKGHETRQESRKIGRNPGVLLDGCGTLQIVLNLINFRFPEHFSCGAPLRKSFAVARVLSYVIPLHIILYVLGTGQMPNLTGAFARCNVNARNPARLKMHASVSGALL